MQYNIYISKTIKDNTFRKRSFDSYDEFESKLATPNILSVTKPLFDKASDIERRRLKDNSAFIAGRLSGLNRNKRTVESRSIIVLDSDGYNEDLLTNIDKLKLRCTVYSTLTHTAAKPKYRILIPLTNEVTPIEYEAVARMLADIIGIDMFDSTTFQYERAMYLPQTFINSEYIFKPYYGAICSPAKYLSMYFNWEDMTEWAYPKGHKARVQQEHITQQDPTTKTGLIGAFCNNFDVIQCLDTFLTEYYTKVNGLVGGQQRYTYYSSQSFGGGVVYQNNKFFYSNHATDPLCGRLCNSFDLLRLCLFPDNTIGGDINEKESIQKCFDFINNNPDCAGISFDKLEAFNDVFEIEDDCSWFMDDVTTVKKVTDTTANILSVLSKLQKDKSGKPLPSSTNINLIFKYDINLANVFRLNTMDGRVYVFGEIVWNKSAILKDGRRLFTDYDMAGLNNYLDCMYGIGATNKISDAFSMTVVNNTFNPIRDIITQTKWDGIPRVETFLTDFFKCERGEYSYLLSRKFFTACVARALNPGCKYDNIIVLSSEEGIGKSYLMRRLAGDYFTDSLPKDVSDKSAYEAIRGKWLVEVAELTSFNKSTAESVKHFLSKQVDSYRAAFGRVLSDIPRSCVFVGTTNETQFLSSDGDERRFFPIRCNSTKYDHELLKLIYSKELDSYIAQLWAEAYDYYVFGENPNITEYEDIQLCDEMRKPFRKSNSLLDSCKYFLDELVPNDFESYEADNRLAYYKLNSDMRPISDAKRMIECPLRLACEFYGVDKSRLTKEMLQIATSALRQSTTWIMGINSHRFKGYGQQRYYIRKHE